MSEPSNEAYNAALALHREGRAAEAERQYREVLACDPGHGGALQGLGVLCLQSGRPDEAIAHLRAAAAQDATSATVRNNLGVAYASAGRFAEAADAYREAVALEPDAASLTNFGFVLNALGAFGEACDVLHRALAASPGSVAAVYSLGVAYAGQDRAAEALPHFERAAATMPHNDEIQCALAKAYLACGRPVDARMRFERALAIAPTSAPALCGLGEALGATDRHQEAIACFERATALAPDFALAFYNKGTALAFLGRLDDAANAFARAVELAPDNPSFRNAVIALGKTANDSPQLAALEALAASDRLSEAQRIELDFTLVKAYDDSAQFERAFACMTRGNAAKRRQIAYDVDRDIDTLTAMREVFTADFLAARGGTGDASDRPLFVVGMPRSGTTLVEQVIASHPHAFGAGELMLLPDLIAGGAAGADFPAHAETADWRALGEAYASKLTAYAPQARRITDKLPLNFALLGAIRLALPQARIVHVRRDPLDTCLSCFSILFEGHLDFTYDLTDLGRYYRAYEGVMAHWRAVLPADVLMEVQYETLVANFETEAKRLVAFCGLTWDEACLKFHETVRPVQTASTFQVRRPLYASSVGRAAHYAQWLEPLRRALDGG